jgi:hypothetical protein
MEGGIRVRPEDYSLRVERASRRLVYDCVGETDSIAMSNTRIWSGTAMVRGRVRLHTTLHRILIYIGGIGSRDEHPYRRTRECTKHVLMDLCIVGLLLTTRGSSPSPGT